MNHIEIIGPSGAGKTTLINKMDGGEVYAGKEGRARCIFQTFSHGYKFMHLPQPFKSALARRIFSLNRNSYTSNFFAENTGTLETMRVIAENVEDPKHIIDMISREAGWFSAHKQVLHEKETYVADDGLYQFHLRISDIENWDATKVIDKLPKPQKLILVRAPSETCLERQESRERGRPSKLQGLPRSECLDELDRMQEAAESFIQAAQDIEIETEILETT